MTSVKRCVLALLVLNTEGPTLKLSLGCTPSLNKLHVQVNMHFTWKELGWWEDSNLIGSDYELKLWYSHF